MMYNHLSLFSGVFEMPVPLNAATEISRTWLSKKLGYFVVDSLPVKPSTKSVQATTAMDMDLVCTHPSKNYIPIILAGTEYELPRNLLVECKGWIDYPSASHDIITGLYGDINLMGDNVFIPKEKNKKSDGLYFTCLKEEFYEKGLEIFNHEYFARVIICPTLYSNVKPRNEPIITTNILLKKAQDKGIFVFQLRPVILDLVKYIKLPENKDLRRRDFVMELIHFLNWAER